MSALNSGDIAWMLTSSALVLIMTQLYKVFRSSHNKPGIVIMVMSL